MSKLKHKWTSLFVIAILIGLIWRTEVEYHGWRGLIWLNYFHYSLPIGYLIFILWSNMLLELKPLNRLYFNIIALTIGCIAYSVIIVSLKYNYSSGPVGFWLLMSTPKWEYYFYQYLLIGIIILLPILITLAIRLFGYRVSVRYLFLSTLGLIASSHLSKFIILISNHKGSPDVIHSIKSGIIFPFIVLSLGLLITFADGNRDQIS